ncbi:uncharacterized protein LOC109708850 [Ananas comosus]|uniref:Uncharacterized protein LOC109708850 n=1 Tax=Ananas comosus TaxID=4615 RepID=A0A6P5ERX2_ANACO|nr:uncharacterized protein LOC109708850 [Ananas comosus]
MAYRRKHAAASPFPSASASSRVSSTFEDSRSPLSSSSSSFSSSSFAAAAAAAASYEGFFPSPATGEAEAAVAAPSLAAQAIRASAAHRDSSLSSAYGESAATAAAAAHRRESDRLSSSHSPRARDSAYEYTSMKSLNESKYGFWGVLARKAKAFLDEDNSSPDRNHSQTRDQSTRSQLHNSYQPPEGYQKAEAPQSQKSSDAIASSFNFIGGTLKNAFEEGRTIVENKTADIIHETRKLNIRRKESGANLESQTAANFTQQNLPRTRTDYETQLKASRDVANAMAAKAKLLLRELKTVKADLAFAKERCAQLEEENKILRESHEKGDSPEDDDLIRLQLETLLAEKARLAHENSVYARENRFLREIVEYHQLTMQDVIYVDEGIEEVTEVYPTQVLPPTPSRTGHESTSPAAPTTPRKPTTSQPSPLATTSSFVLPETCPIVPTSPQPSPSTAVTPNTRATSPPV